MEIEKGAILTGKVTGIAKFGAFVELAPGKSGLVYISEISQAFVRDVSDYLSVGQEVKVKVISIDAAGRINLSVKQAAAPVPPPPPPRRPEPYVGEDGSVVDPAFEDKLKRFMRDSEGKISDLRKQTEKRGPGGRRRSK